MKYRPVPNPFRDSSLFFCEFCFACPWRGTADCRKLETWNASNNWIELNIRAQSSLKLRSGSTFREPRRKTNMDYLKPLNAFDFIKTLFNEPPSWKFSSTLPLVVITVLSADCVRQYMMSLYFEFPQIIPILLDAFIAFEYFIIAFELGVVFEEHGYW